MTLLQNYVCGKFEADNLYDEQYLTVVNWEMRRRISPTATDSPVFVGLETVENVVFVVTKQSERSANVVVFQHGAVVVHQRHI